MRSFFIVAVVFFAGCFSVYSQVVGDFTVNGNVSYSYMIDSQDLTFSARNADDLDGLRNGVSVELSAYYMPRPNLGWGMRYNRFSSSVSVSDIDILAPNNEVGVGDASEDVTISYIGVSQLIRNRSRRFYLSYEPTIGYVRYKNKVYALGDYNVTSKGLGIGCSLSYSYNPFQGFLVGPKIGMLYALMSDYHIEGPDGFGEKQDKGMQNFLRFNAGVMVSYTF